MRNGLLGDFVVVRTCT